MASTSAQPILIPNEFLPPSPPPNTQIRLLDFSRTSPAIPSYANHFAAIISNLYTESECHQMIHLAELSTLQPPAKPTTPTPTILMSLCPSPSWPPATITTLPGLSAYSPETRNCGRILLDSPHLASLLLARLHPFLTSLNITSNPPGWRLSHLNRSLRFLRYEGGEYFRPHWDANCHLPPTNDDDSNRQRTVSFYTIHIYLNGEGEQDLEELQRAKQDVEELGYIDDDEGGEGYEDVEWEGKEDVVNVLNKDVKGKLLGGATTFIPNFEAEGDDERCVRVFPKAGSVLVFQQDGLLHSGDTVYRGTKYTIRTDIMYEKTS